MRIAIITRKRRPQQLLLLLIRLHDQLAVATHTQAWTTFAARHYGPKLPESREVPVYAATKGSRLGTTLLWSTNGCS
ncbi:MAG: hypothetical protein ACR2P2_04325 [Nakamurella sp.]